MIFGWGGKSGPHRGARRAGHQPHDRRGRARGAVRHRRGQAARRPRHPAHPGPGPRRPARGAGAAPRRRARPPPRRHGRRDAPRAGRASPRPSAPRPSTRSPRSPPARDRPLRAAPARDRQRPHRHPARGGARRPRGHGRLGAARRAPAASLFGALPEAIAQRAKPTVIVVKTREAIGRQTFEQLAQKAETLVAADRAAEESRARSRPRWSAGSRRRTSTTASSRTSRASPRSRRSRASRSAWCCRRSTRPRRSGRSCGAPIREMQERFPLLDEILVIDSASTDDTREIAEAEGARVVQHPDVLARYGSFRGKGEALWKSLYETSGDIVVWADTDVRNWHHRMVYGTLGPLLVEPRLQYVKGYYQRPIVEGGVLKEGGGGRVTELVARPLINLFFPELSGLIQPLSGRVRRPARPARADPVLHGLRRGDRPPDRHRREGRASSGLGQVDLERRVHRNQELEGLSRMSFVILQAVMKRLEERRRARLFAELGSTMKLPRSGRGPAVPRGHGARGPRAAADDPDPRVPRATRRGDRAGEPGDDGCSARRRPLATAARPDRARFLQGIAHQRRGRAGARRRLAAGAPGDRCGWLRSRTAARARSSPSRPPAAGRWREAPAADPLGRAIRRRLAGARRRGGGVRRDGRASGLSLVAADERDAAGATSRGTGDLLRAVLDAGIRDIALGIGGSRDDGWRRGAAAGAGRDASATTSATVDLAGWTRGSPRCGLRIACDVTNPLLGPEGPPRSTARRRARHRSCVAALDAPPGAVGGRARGRDRPPRA